MYETNVKNTGSFQSFSRGSKRDSSKRPSAWDDAIADILLPSSSIP